ncbi:MAG: GNAT family N-acetyltransferase, partial [Treponema sp.]|nr:GNAT family N-acetyltransferase [Treponema sp.]
MKGEAEFSDGWDDPLPDDIIEAFCEMRGKMRLAKLSDSAEILKGYAPFVSETPVSFEIEVPTLHEFSSRIEKISKRYPFIVREGFNTSPLGA